MAPSARAVISPATTHVVVGDCYNLTKAEVTHLTPPLMPRTPWAVGMHCITLVRQAAALPFAGAACRNLQVVFDSTFDWERGQHQWDDRSGLIFASGWLELGSRRLVAGPGVGRLHEYGVCCRALLRADRNVVRLRPSTATCVRRKRAMSRRANWQATAQIRD